MLQSTDRFSFASRFSLEPSLLLDLFVITNLGFLAFDIYLAHSMNNFRRPAEYIPLYFSIAAPVFLAISLIMRRSHRRWWNILGGTIGALSIAIGLAGVIFHLDSAFFYERTLRSLTYSAPFVAPLSYTGLGFLLIMNRMVKEDTLEWRQWILLMAAGGFLGNFVLSLADHATNGFFSVAEWVPVWASALAVGFLIAAIMLPPSRPFVHFCVGVLLGEGLVGVWGFILHARANLAGPSLHAFDNFVHGAPPFAPLLFPNLVLLGLLGFWRDAAGPHSFSNYAPSAATHSSISAGV
jgi:hypothetical protein